MAGRFAFMNSAAPADTTTPPAKRGNPFSDFSDERFLKEFRMTKDEVRYVCTLVEDELKCEGNRKTDLSLEQKVLICLKTLASGSFQNCSKDFLSTSQPVVSKLMKAFTEAMVKKLPELIYMPTTQNDMEDVTLAFYQVDGFPGVRANIDGTQIPIIAPPGPDEPLFVNRKNFHSINVQALCDANMVFLDIDARWHGSCHDSFILSASHISDRFERGEFGDGWILGDSGYPLKKWLMTPIENPTSEAEKAYNKAHRKTRCIVERAFGVLKSRWRILDHTGGALCYRPDRVCKIVVTCCMLHNICRRNGTPLIEDSDASTPPVIGSETRATTNSTAGKRQQQRLINYFASV